METVLEYVQENAASVGLGVGTALLTAASAVGYYLLSPPDPIRVPIDLDKQADVLPVSCACHHFSAKHFAHFICTSYTGCSIVLLKDTLSLSLSTISCSCFYLPIVYVTECCYIL